jgi:transketolase
MLNERSKQVRRDTITLSKANGGYHFGGCFSCVEILIALFDYVMSPASDRFILSKGHACWPYYVLLMEKGATPKLQGHPTRDPWNGIPCSTGSLGHGLPMALGMALAKKIKGEPGKVYVLMGDGECQEGTTWESLLIAANMGLHNLVVIVDWNQIQGSGSVAAVSPATTRFPEVPERLGWEDAVVDGHNIDLLRGTLLNCAMIDVTVLADPERIHKEGTAKEQKAPRIIFAQTVKGKGVSFMENSPEWHAKWLDDGHEKQAREELA